MPELLQSIVYIGLNVLQILLQILLQNVQVITTIMSNVIEVTPLPSTDSARFAVKLALSSRSTSSSKNRFLLTSAASCASSSIAAGCVALRCQPSLLSTRSRNWTSAVRLPRDPGATLLRGPRKVFLPYIPASNGIARLTRSQAAPSSDSTHRKARLWGVRGAVRRPASIPDRVCTLQLTCKESHRPGHTWPDRPLLPAAWQCLNPGGHG